MTYLERAKELFEEGREFRRQLHQHPEVGFEPVSYTHLTLPTTLHECRSRWSPCH